jgi:hypothetical protein
MGLLCADNETCLDIQYAAQTTGIAAEVLRAMQRNHKPQEIWGSLGRCIGLPQATLLLAAMCQQPGKLGEFFNRKEKARSQVGQACVRELREGSLENSRPPQGLQFPEQLAWELANALPELSQKGTRIKTLIHLLSEFTGGPLASGVPARVVRLRGYGNAIVPQVAAQFIQAYLETLT